MMVAVGSKNKAKLLAAKRTFGKFFKGVKVTGFGVESRVRAQPLSLEETIKGATNRAKAAWKKCRCDFSVGIEAGLFPVKGTQSGYMDVAAVAIFDGRKVYLGLSPSFEYPKKVVDKILKHGKEVSEVFSEEWNEDTRDIKGAIGRLTKGKVPRHALHEMGLLMALAPVINKKFYGGK